MTAASVSARCSLTYRAVLRCLWLLDDGGYVRRRANDYLRTSRGDAEAARFVPKVGAAKKELKPRKPRAAMKPGPSFSQRYADPEGERYGALFLVVRVMRCWLCRMGYDGPGHRMDGSQDLRRGAQGGHTAHHLHRLDREGMIPGDGAAHDLYAGLGGDTTQRAFKEWLRTGGVTLEDIGHAYVNDARMIVACETKLKDEDLAW
jgi:hypothetical protein